MPWKGHDEGGSCAGVVAHPAAWATAGYHEIQSPPARFRIIDRRALAGALGVQLSSLVETALGHRARNRHVQPFGIAFILRDPRAADGHALAGENEARSSHGALV